MELQDGFIVGMYNYCDRWCEACAFTSRCRSFAMEAQIEARRDASFNDVIPRVGKRALELVSEPRAFVRPAFDEPDDVAGLS